ncbi:multiple PDZ domain protein [Elysia marginata]|uniref:Multiple PDZ domain protein n=1 Tax=Elysia marginata TaxID=1093978 RepID=A0AAV4JY20_9GAST|nr:multiple PDZ domain protein [Elysia marginata]
MSAEVSVSRQLGGDGRLQEGDQLLAINGQALEVSHQDAIRILQSAHGTAEIVVARGSAQPDQQQPIPYPPYPEQLQEQNQQQQEEGVGDEGGEAEDGEEERPGSLPRSPRSVGSGEPVAESLVQEEQAASAAASPRTAGEEEEEGGGEDAEEDGGGEVDEDDGDDDESKLGQEKSDMVVSTPKPAYICAFLCSIKVRHSVLR